LGGRGECADQHDEEEGECLLHKGIDAKMRQVFEAISAAVEMAGWARLGLRWSGASLRARRGFISPQTARTE
jgi:hypothetical protein